MRELTLNKWIIRKRCGTWWIEPPCRNPEHFLRIAPPSTAGLPGGTFDLVLYVLNTKPTPEAPSPSPCEHVQAFIARQQVRAWTL